MRSAPYARTDTAPVQPPHTRTRGGGRTEAAHSTPEHGEDRRLADAHLALRRDLRLDVEVAERGAARAEEQPGEDEDGREEADGREVDEHRVRDDDHPLCALRDPAVDGADVMRAAGDEPRARRRVEPALYPIG
jgi:hypothetical protein